jgi:ABC-type ATPase involved in cell division
MLKHCLVFNQAVLPGPPGMWPLPVDLILNMQEVLVIENLGSEESPPLAKVAAALRPPVAGLAWHWDEDAFNLARADLYLLRRRIAYLVPGMVLLSRLTLGENIALSITFYEGTSTRSVLSGYSDVLERLGLTPYLSRMPHEVEIKVYIKAIWARELIKQPELVVAVRDEAWEPFSVPNEGILVLQEYLASRQGAALLMGRSMENFHPLASRLLRWEAGRLSPQPLPGRQGRPLTDFLPLIPQE